MAKRLAGIRLKWITAISIAVSAIAPPAAAYDLDAAAAAFDADKVKLTGSPPVLEGWSGNDSKVGEYSIERIMDRTAWRAAWARHAPGTKAPDLDFSAAMVIAIFAGATTTSVIPEIHLDRITDDDRIDVTTMNYVNDVISEERKNLYVIVVLRRSMKAVRVFARSHGLMRTPQEETILLKEFAAISPPK